MVFGTGETRLRVDLSFEDPRHFVGDNNTEIQIKVRPNLTLILLSALAGGLIGIAVQIAVQRLAMNRHSIL